jgi:hypothetical protein
MRSIVRLALAAAVLAAFAAPGTPARAQCSFPHPHKAGKYQASLAQAFLPCVTEPGSSCCATANGTTEGGVPSCAPPETFNDLFGDPPDGWLWSPASSGQVLLKASNTFPTNVLDPPSNSADVLVSLKIAGIVANASGGGPANGDGNLGMFFRATFDDRVGGDTTVLDIPLTSAFTLSQGKAKLKTTVDVILNGDPLHQPGLPRCSNLEVVAIQVRDPNGATFANAGLFLP